jgi:hypothetical protein
MSRTRLPQVCTQSGSLLSLSWSADGMRVACGGSGGVIALAALLGHVADDGRLRAEVVGASRVVVSDLGRETEEQLDFREPVTRLALGG